MNKTQEFDFEKKVIEKLDLIADDMKKDAINFDGKIFNGVTVATYLGHHGAAIAALAKILKMLLVRKEL